jgi:hypothetical protein
LITAVLAGCGNFSQPQVSSTESATETPQPAAMVKFTAVIPADTDPQAPIYLNIVDDVTGIDYLSDRYLMTRDGDNILSIQLPFPIHTFIKYRYSIGSEQQTYEINALNETVKFRVYSVGGNDEVRDQIFGWSKSEAGGTAASGRISGKLDIHQITTAVPTDLRICAAGICTSASADGSFLLSGVQPGEHHLVVFSPQGQIAPIQQYVQVKADENTPVDLTLPTIQWVNVTFSVDQPEGFSSPSALRMVGNISLLGSIDYDDILSTSIYPRRAPELVKISDQTYGINLLLPAGFDLKYKYTYGDGFWNSELASDGSLFTRELIVPDHSIEIHDRIGSWQPAAARETTFSVKVPENTPETDQISIQFNAYGWKTPLPMTRVDKNIWQFTLYNPVLTNQAFFYRYCRNDQCAALAENPSPQSTSDHRIIVSTSDHQDAIPSWSWWNPLPTPQTVVIPNINRRDSDFLIGAGIVTNDLKMGQPFFSNSQSDLHQTGFKDVILSPEWNEIGGTSPYFEPSPDYPQEDLVTLANSLKNGGMNLILYPSLRYSMETADWWQKSRRDFPWWQTWFDQYTRFILNYADLAQSLGLKGIILGGPSISPALPSGMLSDGSSSDVPHDAEDRWLNLITEVRSHFNGKLYWDVNYASDFQSVPAFSSKFDALILEFNFSPVQSSGSLPMNRILTFRDDLDDAISNLQSANNQKIIFAFSIPSTQANADTPNDTDQVLSWRAYSDSPATGEWTDQQSQLDNYNTLLAVLNDYPWVGGIICNQYFLSAKAQDPTASVHGKWSETLLNYWFTALQSHP